LRDKRKLFLRMLNAGEDGKGLEKEKNPENLSGGHFKIQVRYFSKIFLQKIVILIFITWSRLVLLITAGGQFSKRCYLVIT